MTLVKGLGVNANDAFLLGLFLSALLFPTPSDSDSLSRPVEAVEIVIF
jgi:hypothetical protein